MSAQRFADEIKVNRVTVHKYESGNIKPSAEVLARIALLASEHHCGDYSQVFWGEFCLALGISLPAMAESVKEAA